MCATLLMREETESVVRYPTSAQQTFRAETSAEDHDDEDDVNVLSRKRCMTVSGI